MGILAQLPDITATANSSARLQADLGTLVGALGSLQPDKANSPLAALFAAFGELRTRLDVDPLTVTGDLSSAVQAIENALPANALGYVESLDSAYTGVVSFLSDSDIARQVGEGQTLNAVAQAVIEEALGLFESHIDDLAGNLVGGDRLEEVRRGLALIQGLEDDFAGHQADLLPFLANHLLGVTPDLLDAPLAHVQSVLDVLKPLQDSGLVEVLGPPRRAVMAAYGALIETVDTFGPADPAGYVQINTQLGDLAAANNLLFAAMNTLYTQLETLIAGQAWDAVFTTYVTLLDALDVGTVPTVDDVAQQLEAMIDELLASLLAVFDADDLRGRIEVLSKTMRDAVLGSPIGQVKQTIEELLERIRAAIEAVPTEDVQRVVNEMLGKVQNAVAQLNIDQVQQAIDQVFAGVDEFVNTNLNVTVRQNLQDALAGLSGSLNSLPLTNLINDLNGAIGQIQNLLGELTGALQGQLDGLKGLLAQAEALSYKPVSDAVIAEIDDLKARLAAINPNALSDVEKLALTAALAVIEAIDLQTQVIGGLKSGYHSAEVEVRSILDQIAAALNQLRDKIGVFNPDTILQPINAALESANQLLDKVNARTLLAPLYTQVDTLRDMLEELAPGRLLDPLQGAFDQSLGLLNRLDPAQWVAPLNDLYAQIDRLISVVDITPVMDELDRKERELLGKARDAILNGFDALDLPEPLKGFTTEMRPIVELMTDAIFGDPDIQLKEVGVSIRGQVRLGTLFAPLDEMFLRLVAMIEKVPPDELTAAMNAIRQSIGVGLEVLNPQTLIAQLRAGYGRLQEMAPANLLAQTVGLGSVKAYFAGRVEGAPAERNGEIVSVSARFDAVVNVTLPGVSGSQYAQLAARHAQMLDSLRRRINQIDRSPEGIAASEHYAALANSLDRVLPDFLRQRTPLTHADILTGLQRMRPSNKMGAIEDMFTRFLRQLEPYESAIEPAVNGFFGALREIVQLLNPLSLRDSVASIYETLRQKTHVLDPAQLAAGINAILDPIKTAVQALSPAAFKARIDASYNNVVTTVTVTLKALLDDLVGVIDGQLRTLRAALHAVIDQLKAALQAALATLGDLLKQIEDLVFVEIIERLRKVIDNLGVSFDQELERVANAFDEMLHAIPLDGVQSAGLSL
jgi:hypothetical protein